MTTTTTTLSPIASFYAMNSGIVFDLTIDSGARKEFRTMPSGFVINDPSRFNEIVYDNGLNKFLPPLLIPVEDTPPNWKQTDQNIKLSVSYPTGGGNTFKSNIDDVQARVKGFGSFRPYNRQSPFKIKKNNFISGLFSSKDITLNSMGQNLGRINEYLIYKIFNDYGMPAPRANYARVFINDTTVKISGIQNNIITTDGNHYLVEGIGIKFVSFGQIPNDKVFYIIGNNLTQNTFKVSETLNGSEYLLNNFAPSNPSQFIQFFTDYGEYLNVENVKNEYRLTELFGPNNTKNLYEINVTAGTNEFNANASPDYDTDYTSVSNNRSDLSNYLSAMDNYINWYQNIQQYIDLDQFIKFSVIETYCSNWDGYSYFLNNSHLHSDANGKFRLIPWGTDGYFKSGYSLLTSTYQNMHSRWINQCLSHVETLYQFRDEMIKFHIWFQKEYDILDTIDDIFNKKIGSFESDKKKPSILTRQYLIDQKDSIKNYINDMFRDVHKFLLRPYCVTNISCSFDGISKIFLNWDEVTKNLYEQNIYGLYYVILYGEDARISNMSPVGVTQNTNFNIDLPGDIDTESPAYFVILPLSVVYIEGVRTELAGFPSNPRVVTNLSVTTTTTTTTTLPPMPLIRITEVMSDGADWFELTNYGSSTVNISGWKMDDDSFSLSAAVNIIPYNWNGDIESSGSIVCIETRTPPATITNFKTTWSISDPNIKFATYTGSKVSFNNDGDKVIVFDNYGRAVSSGTFGAATAKTSFYWLYNSAGNVLPGHPKTSDISNSPAYKSNDNQFGSPGKQRFIN